VTEGAQLTEGTPEVMPDAGGRRPRVLIAVEQLRRPVPGGVGTYAKGLLQGLAAMSADAPGGLDLTLLASRSPDKRDPLSDWGWPVESSALPGPLLTRAWDRGLVRSPRNFDVVHSVSLAFPSLRRANREGNRSSPSSSSLVVTVHDLSWRRHPELTTPRGRRWHEAGLERALSQARALVVPSQTVAEDLREAGARESDVRVIREGCDHLALPDQSAAEDMLRRAGVDGPYLLSVGTLEPRKNLVRLADAYSKARDLLPAPWPLVVVGPDGWGNVAESLQGRPGVVRLGYPDGRALAALYAGCRCFVYVPLEEGFGLPPLEAMRVGAPVVAADSVPSVFDQAQDGEPPADGDEAALKVDPLDVDAMSDALVSAATDEDVRAGLIARGAELARSLTWRSAAEAHLELWRSLA